MCVDHSVPARNHVFLLMSGGYDSTALALYWLELGAEIHPVKITYDSRQIEPEEKALNEIMVELYQLYGSRVHPLVTKEVPLDNPSTLAKEHSADEVESGKYSDQEKVSTVVPGRNLLFLTMLANMAEAYSILHGNPVFISAGIHSSDWEMYPDCRPEFLKSASETIRLSSDQQVLPFFPFCNISKSKLLVEVFEMYVQHDNFVGSFQECWKRYQNRREAWKTVLSKTYSCYRGGRIHCGTCPTCIERHQAMVDAFENDPTIYEHIPVKDEEN